MHRIKKQTFETASQGAKSIVSSIQNEPLGGFLLFYCFYKQG